tara:strand:+ start:32 stop:277 length:246 start_codon:yes stop_codon:yes gene_type:complete
MFEHCPKVGRMCAMCGEGKWSPVIRSYTEDSRLFCGSAPPSFDVTVGSLPQCPLNMTQTQKTAHSKKMKAMEKKLFPRRFT